MKADDLQETTVFLVQPSFHHRQTEYHRRYHRRRTCSHTSPRRSPTMVTLHGNHPPPPPKKKKEKQQQQQQQQQQETPQPPQKNNNKNLKNKQKQTKQQYYGLPCVPGVSHHLSYTRRLSQIPGSGDGLEYNDTLPRLRLIARLVILHSVTFCHTTWRHELHQSEGHFDFCLPLIALGASREQRDVCLLHVPPRWPCGKASPSRAEDPGFKSRLRRDFSGSSHTSDLKKLALQWLSCQAPGVTGSALSDWVRWKVWSATSISVWQHVKLSVQIRP